MAFNFSPGNIKTLNSVGEMLPQIKINFACFQSDNEPFYLHQPSHQTASNLRKSERHRESKRGTKSRERYSHSSESGVRFSNTTEKHNKRISSEGVRFSELDTGTADHLHRSNVGSWESQKRYYSGDYSSSHNIDNYRSDRSHGSHKRFERGDRKSSRYNRDVKSSSRRSHSMESQDDVQEIQRQKSSRERRGSSKDRRDSSRHDYQDGKRNTDTRHHSRSKSHDSNHKMSSQEEYHSPEHLEHHVSGFGDSQESYHTPFYLHKSSDNRSVSSSHHGYERIQSLFYESTTDQSSDKREASSGKKHRDKSPKKRVEYNLDTNNNDKDSPKRRAAPAMPLPQSGE